MVFCFAENERHFLLTILKKDFIWTNTVEQIFLFSKVGLLKKMKINSSDPQQKEFQRRKKKKRRKEKTTEKKEKNKRPPPKKKEQTLIHTKGAYRKKQRNKWLGRVFA